MYIEFKKLRFKNILSYGNVETEIDFQSGLNVIKAANGSGKSTILDALTFVLFGKPYRNIKLSELVNRTNNKNLEVTVDFKIGNDNYTITRGLKPTIFEIYRNQNPLDLLSSKKLNQDEIDKLLGINLRLFKNIVCIAVTNNKPFLEMSIGDKRALVENIFNIDVLGAMCKDVKKRRSLKQSEQQLKQTELIGVNNSITDNENYITNITNYINNFNELKQKNIDIITNNISNCRSRIKKANDNITLANKKILELTNEIGEKPDVTTVNNISMEIGKVFSKMEHIEQTLEKLQKSAVCPVCNSPLTEGHAKKHIESMKSERIHLENDILHDLQTQYKQLQDNIDEYKKKTDFIKTIKDKVVIEENTKQSAEQQITDYQIQLESESTKECPNQLDTYNEKLSALKEQATAINNALAKIEESLAIDAELINILGDDGMKTYFFKKLTDILNKNINEYLIKFELPIQIKFDETMQETITENMNITSYSSYSGGERTRIDISILLSFFNVSRIISNWSTNILIIDELLDAGIDDSGLEQFIATLYNVINDNKKKLGIYIVSHKLNEIKVQTASTIEIKKHSGFSSLEIIK